MPNCQPFTTFYIDTVKASSAGIESEIHHNLGLHMKLQNVQGDPVLWGDSFIFSQSSRCCHLGKTLTTWNPVPVEVKLTLQKRVSQGNHK